MVAVRHDTPGHFGTGPQLSMSYHYDGAGRIDEAAVVAPSTPPGASATGRISLARDSAGDSTIDSLTRYFSDDLISWEIDGAEGLQRNDLRGTEVGDALWPQGAGEHVDRRRAWRHVEGDGGPTTQRTGMQRRPNAASGFVAGPRGNLLRAYVFLPDGFTPLMIVEFGAPPPTTPPAPPAPQAGTIYFVHNDHLSTPKAVTDLTGDPVWLARHQPFGQPQELCGPNGTPNPNGPPLPGPCTFSQPLRFPGQRDQSDAHPALSGFWYNWHRFYLPQWGMYSRLDPLWEQQGRYWGYAGGNPLTAFDPKGLIGPGLEPSPEALHALGDAEMEAVGFISDLLRALNDAFERSLPANDPVDMCIWSFKFWLAGYAIDAVAAASAARCLSKPAAKAVDDCASIPNEGPQGLDDRWFSKPDPPPGAGWEWRGKGPPGSGKGNWYKPETGKSLHPNLEHAPPIGPHWDYWPGGNGGKVRLY